MDEAQELVTVGLRDKLDTIPMLPARVLKSQHATTSITAAGLDSLNAIELRNWIGKELLTSGSVSLEEDEDERALAGEGFEVKCLVCFKISSLRNDLGIKVVFWTTDNHYSPF